MSEKMTCPVCDSHTSTVLSRVLDGEPCPYCGAPADLILQVNRLQERNVDEKLIEQLKDMGVRLSKAEAERDRLRSIVENVRYAVAKDAEG